MYKCINFYNHYYLIFIYNTEVYIIFNSNFFSKYL